MEWAELSKDERDELLNEASFLFYEMSDGCREEMEKVLGAGFSLEKFESWFLEGVV